MSKCDMEESGRYNCLSLFAAVCFTGQRSEAGLVSLLFKCHQLPLAIHHA